MTTADDKAARQARAARLRERIEGITAGPAQPEEAGAKDAAGQQPPANPRDFIAKRMRELAPKKK